MKDSSVIKDPGPLHAVDNVDINLGPEVYVLEDSLLRGAEEFDDNFGASNLIMLIDKKGAVVVWEIEIDLDKLFFEPPGDSRFMGLMLDALPELFAIDHNCYLFNSWIAIYKRDIIMNLAF